MKLSAFLYASVILLHVRLISYAGTVVSENGSLFDPNMATSPLGHVEITSDVTFDTGASGSDTEYPDGTSAGDLARSAGYAGGSGVEMAMFTFKSLSIGAEGELVTVTVTGNRGLVLASLTHMTIGANVTFNLQGNSSTSSSGAAGAPGAEGGNRDSSYNSDPPPANAGNGSNGAYGSGPWPDGRGHGGGGGTPWHITGGAGAGYGSTGGNGAGTGGTTPIGGPAYGNQQISELYGGSGGSGGCGATRTGGGGGGGSIELVACGTLTFAGTINAYGGNAGDISSGNASGGGGGGSGGGVILCATALEVTGTINARGGDGGTTTSTGTYSHKGGGGGAGGRVAWYTDSLDNGDSNNVDISGGARGTGPNGNGQTGSDGSFYTDTTDGCPFEIVPPAGTVIFVR